MSLKSTVVSLAALNAKADEEPVAIVGFDAEGVIRQWNAVAVRLYGYAAKDALGGHITMLMPSDAGGQWRRALETVRAGQPVEQSDGVHLTARGTRLHVNASWRPVEDPDGRAGGALVYVRDRTRRIIEQREHTALLAVATAATSSGSDGEMVSRVVRTMHGTLQERATLVWLADAAGGDIVPAARLGIVGNPPPAAFGALEAAARRALRSREPVITRGLSDVAPALSTTRDDRAGTVISVPMEVEGEGFGVLQVVTESYRGGGTQASTLRVAAHFVAMALRDRRLVAQLEGTIGELRQANKELDEYGHAVAHDLAEPLRSVRGFSRLLLDMDPDDWPEKGPDYLRRIEAGAARLREMLDALRVHARAGRDQETAEAVEVADVVRAVEESLSTFLTERRGRIEVVADLPRLVVPRTHLFEVLMNLVGNGIKFNDRRRPLVRIGSRRFDSHREVWVEDDGIGIPDGMKERVFELFTRGHPPEKYPGTGAGLAIASKYVSRWGGHLACEPGASGGTRFTFTVPAIVRGPAAGTPAADVVRRLRPGPA
jgi:PAS domain S-box-containing protein